MSEDQGAGAHEQLQRATGAGLPAAVSQIATVSSTALALLDLLDALEDDDGRQIWMVAGEVELDHWVEKVVRTRDGLRKLVR